MGKAQLTRRREARYRQMMLTVLSPAKNLDFSPAPGAPAFTAPRLSADTAELAGAAKALSRAELKRLMGISDDLAGLTHARFQAFDATPAHDAMAAAFAFAGDVYRGFDARSLDADALAFAQEHVRLLSGLYGVLRPLDAIVPYRLEMGTKLTTTRGGDLYAFWGARIAETLNADFAPEAERTLVNLASKEYFAAVDRAVLDATVITPAFKDVKDGKSRVLFMYAKRARGLMARWIVENRITRAADLKAFDGEGYRFAPAASCERDWVFERPQPAKKAA